MFRAFALKAYNGIFPKTDAAQHGFQEVFAIFATVFS